MQIICSNFDILTNNSGYLRQWDELFFVRSGLIFLFALNWLREFIVRIKCFWIQFYSQVSSFGFFTENKKNVTFVTYKK